jgi:hypothetical protein
MPKLSLSSAAGYHFKGGGSGGAITIQDEGVEIGTYQILNFIGTDVSALDGGSRANIYIPAVNYVSHFNTSDGSNGNQSVTESTARSTTRISTPSGGEGSPFSTGGWAGTNRSTTRNGTFTFTTPGDVTGLGGDAHLVVEFFDADGTTVLESFTTPAITADGTLTSSSGFIQVTTTSFSDDANRKKGNLSISVNALQILSAAGRSGGRVHVEIQMMPDSSTDGTGPYTYVQPDVFIDSNPSTPSVGSAAISEGTPVIKHLSGLAYYTTGSTFTLQASGVDDLNANTIKTSNNLTLSASEYGISTLAQSPFGSGQSLFSGWTNDNNNTGTSYNNAGATISVANHRYAGDDANADAFASDPWANGGSVSSSVESILVDTYGSDSTALYEGFTDEARRLESDYTTAWTSSAALTAGEAMVYFGELISPDQARLSNNSTEDDWTRFNPNPSSQPDYTGLSTPVRYFRKFTESGFDIASMNITFTGQFPSNAANALAAGDLEVFVRRISGQGNTGTTAPPLRVHGGLYNFASFDDGATVAGSRIRESTSSGNSINATFGGLSARDGVYMEVQIQNAAIRLSSIEVTFF